MREVAAGLVGRPGETGAASAGRMLRALTGHELRLTMTRGESLLVTFAIPIAVLAFFSSVDVLPRLAGRAVDALLPGAIALAVVATCLVSLSIATAYERAYGVLKRLAGTGAANWHRVAAKTLAVLLIELVQAVVLVAIAIVAFAWSPGPDASAALTIGAVALGSVTFASAGILLAGTLRPETTLAVANALLLVALLVGDVVVPLDRLPGTLAPVAAALPFAALVDLVRAGLGAGARDPGAAAAILAGWGTVAVVAAVRLTRWD